MWHLFLTMAVYTAGIFASEWAIFRFGGRWSGSAILSPLAVGWISGICAYELLENALHMLTHAVAISAIGSAFLLSRGAHSFIHDHHHRVERSDGRSSVEITSHMCSLVRDGAVGARVACGTHCTESASPPPRRRIRAAVVQKHVAFGLHVAVDGFVVGLAYSTPVFVAICLVIGLCMLQDTAALSFSLKQVEAARPHLQACVSVSVLSWLGICLGALLPVPPSVPSVASSVSIGLLLNELTEYDLPHVHRMQAIKQTCWIGIGMAIACTFYVASHVAEWY